MSYPVILLLLLGGLASTAATDCKCGPWAEWTCKRLRSRECHGDNCSPIEVADNVCQPPECCLQKSACTQGRGECSVGCSDGKMGMERLCDDGCLCCRECNCEDWTEWGPCTAPCDKTITEKRIRKCDPLSPPGCLTDTRTCSGQICGCECGPWGEWAPCEVNCLKTRTRACHGAGCADILAVGVDTIKCVGTECCTCDSWNDWTRCTAACERSRTRICSGDGVCPDRAENNVVCPKEDCCNCDPWSFWSECNFECEKTKTRYCEGPGSKEQPCTSDAKQGLCGNCCFQRQPCTVLMGKCAFECKGVTRIGLCDSDCYCCLDWFDVCDPDPCKNGGTCTVETSGAHCLCTDGWKGGFCQEVDEFTSLLD